MNRSRRFFLLVIHLVVVSRKLTTTPSIAEEEEEASWRYVWTIWDPTSSSSSSSTTVGDDSDAETLYFLQTQQNECLNGQGQLSPCGDATTWILFDSSSTVVSQETSNSKRPQRWALGMQGETKKRRRPSPKAATPTFTSLYDVYQESCTQEVLGNSDNVTQHHISTSHRWRPQHCLVRSRKHHELTLAPCSSRSSNWEWDDQGRLVWWEPTPYIQQPSPRTVPPSHMLHHAHSQPTHFCLAPSPTTTATTTTHSNNNYTSSTLLPTSAIFVPCSDSTYPPLRFTIIQQQLQETSATNAARSHHHKNQTRHTAGLFRNQSSNSTESTTGTGAGTASSTPATSTTAHTSTQMSKLPPTSVAVLPDYGPEWTDSATGLAFPLDLNRYLAWPRRTVDARASPYTLMGVGYYMKTVFQIKVYGVALYVSEDDIRSDPVLSSFAGYTAQQLTQQPDLYHRLRSPDAAIDRTLLLKTNMQLSTETLRSSLDADWKLLTPEAKKLLIGSSMRPRPASPRMMQVIQDVHQNPTQCSCAQEAPEGTAECCARGTELAFTWKSNGSLEVRLNGEHMDTFGSDMAEAIFFEYLRLDDPMSPDFLERLAEGFPLVLGTSGPFVNVPGEANNDNVEELEESRSNPIVRGLTAAAHAVWAGGNTVAQVTLQVTADAGQLTMAAVKTVGDATQTLGGEVNRRRRLVSHHLNAFAHHAWTMIVIYPQRHRRRLDTAVVSTWLDPATLKAPPAHPSPSANAEKPYHHPNEQHDDHTISSTEQVLFGLVHLYLLLLWLGSLPSTTTRRPIPPYPSSPVGRKRIMSRQFSAQWLSDSEDSDASVTVYEELSCL